MPFLDSLDIANRAIQHLGGSQIRTVDEDSKNNQEASFAYDKVRRAELRRNVWRFSIRKVLLRPLATTTLLLAPPLFDSTAVYQAGAIVKDANARHWQSLIPNNMANEPGGGNEAWEPYFGPLTVELWDEDTSYYAGELVYKAGAEAGSYQVYRSLKNANEDTPSTADAWSTDTTYYEGQTVSHGGFQWRSLIPFNTGVTPTVGPLDWDEDTTYSIGNTVTGSDHYVYESLINSNLDADPVADDGTRWERTTTITAWAKTPTITAAATSWLPLGYQSLQSMQLLYPVGAGPVDEVSSRNIYRLPAGFLREAPQDPKRGASSFLGAPSGLHYSDWTLEGDFFTTNDSTPLVFRFVADVTVVRNMDDMFCEGLACRLAQAICYAVTQSTSKLQSIAAEYNRFMSEARIVNAIEVGSEEPPVDDWIACRA